jgi:amino acid adenylation domain-containing protein
LPNLKDIADVLTRLKLHNRAKDAVHRSSEKNADLHAGAAHQDRSGPPLSATLSPAQERLWITEQLKLSADAYTIPWAIELKGVLVIDALRASFATLIQRHESLRTCFRQQNGGPIQIVMPFEGFDLPFIDLSTLGIAEAENKSSQLLADFFNAPFDLVQGPILRAQLLRLEKQRYILAVTVHHLVADGWSMGVIARELSAVYIAFSQNKPHQLPALRLRAIDHAIRQRYDLAGHAIQRQLAYWREKLNALPSLDLPLDKPRPALQSYAGGVFAFEIDPTLAEEIAAFARRENLTLYMVLLAAFHILLSTHANQDDFGIGTPISGRVHKETHDIVGFLVNTVVMRNRLDPALTVREFLRQVRHTALDAYERQDSPFDKLVAELDPNRDLSRQPLFQVNFAMLDTSEEVPSFPGLQVKRLKGSATRSKFDLTLFAQVRQSGLHFSFEYATDLFEPDTIGRFANHFRIIVQHMLSDPEGLVANIDPMDDTEKQHLLSFSQGRAENLPVSDIAALIAAKTQHEPDAIALIEGQHHLSYRALGNKVDALCLTLHKAGAGPETIIGMCMTRSSDMVCAMLAILKAGAAYLPLDPAYPRERLAFMIADADPLLILCDEAGQQTLAGQDRLLAVQKGPIETAAETRAKSLQVDPLSIAYVIYTSGSTGKPKGVAGTYQGLVNRLCWFGADCATQGPGLAKSSISFIDGLTETLAPLLLGNGLVLAGNDASPDRLAALVERHRVTSLVVVPSLLPDLAGQADHYDLTACRQWIVSGERLLPDTADHILSRFAHARLLNFYGASEATGDSLFTACETGKPIAIGRPIWNTQASVLTRDFLPALGGMPGELFLAGHGLARSYLRRPGLTAERFIPNPFGPPGGRFYRTGDLAAWNADSRIDYLGRADRQIKIRGMRIEPGEIEAVLASHPSVARAAVAEHRNANGESFLIGYAVLKDRQQCKTLMLQQHMRERLPQAFVPAHIVLVEDFPRTPSGKIDRTRLPEPRPETGGQEPQSPREKTLARLFTKILGVSHVTLDDHFFHLGGHSLAAMRLASSMRLSLGYNIDIKDIFENPTIRSLSAHLQQISNIQSMPSRRLQDSYPLSPMQQRIWFSEELQGPSATFTIPMALRLEGVLDTIALEEALNDVIARLSFH